MKRRDYEELRGILLQHQEAEEQGSDAYNKRLKAARDRFPGVDIDTVMSIIAQEGSRRLKALYPSLTASSATEHYSYSYLSGQDILDISRRNRVPPCILLRSLLQSLFNLPKQSISQCLKDPLSIPRILDPSILDFEIDLPEFVRDAERCIEADHLVSPRVEMVRRVAGLEYEHLLRTQLLRRGIPFLSEEALRAAGFSKTPDVKLEVPIAVCGRVVNWIDSKASFGDDYAHKNQGMTQFQRYVNRFGPGLVIYWFGFIEDLDDHPDILLLDHFPKDDEIYCLPRLNVKPRS